MILQVNKMYSPDIGGVETVVKEYSEYLKEFEDVIVLCCHKNFSIKTTKEIIEGVKVYRCASFGSFMSMPISIVFFFYLFILSRKANFIHFHEPFPLGTLGSLLIPKSKKIFVTWHSDIIKQKRVKKIFEFFQEKLCLNATKIITTSERLIEFSRLLKKFRSKVLIIPLSINRKKYLEKALDNVYIKNLPKDYVLFLGRFSYYKGIFVLLHAIEMIDEMIPFVIVGNGELSNEIKNRIKKSKKNILLVDRFVTDDEKKYLLKNSKFMVFPSIYPSEAFGILQLESMIYGKPVINTNLPTGVPWVSLHEETGLTVAINNPKQLAKTIIKLYENHDLVDRLGSGSIERVNNLFCSNVTNKQLHSLYFGS
ncbi:glycosyltransferase [Arcobacter arenosus]|uniref:glycosyltransferase n=1 Tax=Arcobacter arenosus TaxID=2576037 RepID=UPI003BAB8155